MKTIVRVCKVPRGDAPLEIRKQWVGLSFPVGWVINSEEFSRECGKITNCCGVVITIQNAVIAISPRSQKAVAWLLSNVPTGHNLIFSSDEVEVISGSRFFVPTPLHVIEKVGLFEAGISARDHPVKG
ncbi:MAG: hypothetical protein NT077_00380 [Candidatus Taylorbacteria bacterium]|nr:hypothetical protein [Candidatus Taylorbacteria bacterium]